MWITCIIWAIQIKDLFIMISSISEITQLWDKALTKIEKRLGEKQVFDSFFAGSFINEIKGDVIVVAVNSAIAVSLMSGKYYDLIAETINEITESNFSLEFIQENDIKRGVEITAHKVEKKVEYFANSAINPDCTFENFVVGSFNREASQAVKHTLWIGTADIRYLYVGGKVARDSVVLSMNSPEKVCVN